MAIPYQNLKHNQIRLLQNVQGTLDRDLRFRLVHASLGQRPHYTAMSYTWGSEPASEKISIDGKPVLVSPNLFAGLHILRRTWQLIWVDNVCINQKDISERNSQVRMMDRIYAGAATVSVWLGTIPIPPHLHYTGKVVTVEVDDFDWADSMDDLANRPYWSRSWVIQEFLLGKEVHLYCGNSMVGEDLFRDLLSDAAGLDLLGTQILDVVHQPATMRRWPALPLVIERHCDRYPEICQPLYDLLAGNAHTQSSDPRDRVFSLIGLLPQDERGLLEMYFPDYKLTLHQVNLITLAHIGFFAGDEPLKPILQALHIHDPSEIRRLLWMLTRFDYVGGDNPTMDLEFVSSLLESQSANNRTSVGLQFDIDITSETTLNNILRGSTQRGTSLRRKILPLGCLLSMCLFAVVLWGGHRGGYY